MLVIAVVWPLRTLDVNDNGIRTTAQVQDIERSGKTTDYDISFTLADGETFETWTDDVHTGTQVRDFITVTYLADDPTRVDDVRNLETWWVPALFFVPAAALVLGFAGSLWRRDRDTMGTRLEGFRRRRARSDGP